MKTSTLLTLEQFEEMNTFLKEEYLNALYSALRNIPSSDTNVYELTGAVHFPNPGFMSGVEVEEYIQWYEEDSGRNCYDDIWDCVTLLQ